MAFNTPKRLSENYHTIVFPRVEKEWLPINIKPFGRNSVTGESAMRAFLALLCGAVLVLTLNFPAGAVDVRDEAQLFEPGTLLKANQMIRDIKDKFKQDLVVESFATVPKTMVDKVAKMSGKEKADFFALWGVKRNEIL